MNHYIALIALAMGMLQHSAANATDWIFSQSYFSHNPETGRRLTQYAPTPPVLIQLPLDYVRSGYRNTESRIQVAGSADRLHITEEWGRPVRPYGEWQFPYRPFSVPYDLWGSPYPGYSYGPRQGGLGPGYGYGYGYGPRQTGHRSKSVRHSADRPGDRPVHEPEHGKPRHPDPHPFPGDDGNPGSFFDIPTTDHEFFWPRPRDPERRGVPPPAEATPAPDG